MSADENFFNLDALERFLPGRDVFAARGLPAGEGAMSQGRAEVLARLGLARLREQAAEPQGKEPSS